MLFEKALEVCYLNDAACLILVSAPTPKELIDKMEVSKREMMLQLVANFTKIKGKADYAIFLTTSYDIIFQWWSYIHNSDPDVSVERVFFFESLNLPPQTFNVKKWPHPADYVGCVT